MKYVWCDLANYTPVTIWCLENVLHMEDYALNVKWRTFADSHQGEFSPPNNIFIAQDAQAFDTIRILFHEIRHYFQFKTGMYDFITAPYLRTLPKDMPENRKWHERYLDYRNFPWELDADKFSMETFQRFWKEPASNFHKSNTNL